MLSYSKYIDFFGGAGVFTVACGLSLKRCGGGAALAAASRFLAEAGLSAAPALGYTGCVRPLEHRLRSLACALSCPIACGDFLTRTESASLRWQVDSNY